MTSEERREARYQRRRAKRDAKIEEYSKTFEEVFSFENLYQAGLDCGRGAGWKASIINFKTNMVLDLVKIYDDLHSGKRKFRGFRSFLTWEHGKCRAIDALHIHDRIPQKCLCTNFLTKAYGRSFIYDNGACLPTKGMHFQLKRLKKHLADHYRKHGTQGGILQYDFKGYFSSIPHEGIKERARNKIKDPRLFEFFCTLVDEYQQLKGADPHAEVKRGIGLGSEISQVVGLDYASPIDHYIKDELGIHGYGRYNDDGYVIHESLDVLVEIREKLAQLADALDIQLSPKKCIITPFKHHGFTFLKMRFRLTETGKIVMRISRRTAKVMRHKLKFFRRQVTEGKLSFEDAAGSFQSWRGYARKNGGYNLVHTLDCYFVRLFADELREQPKRFKCTCSTKLTPNGWVYDYK